MTRSLAALALVIALAACGSTTTSSSSPATSASPTAVAVSPSAGSHLLPIGDGKIGTTPKVGYVDVCHTSAGPGGVFKDGPWIRGDGTWDPTQKVHVQGAVSWPQAVYDVAVSGGTRKITTMDVPLHQTTGTFPVASSDPAAQYDRNPNHIAATPGTLSLPATPSVASQPACVGGGRIGILNDGVYLFDALDGQNRDAPAHEVLDGCEGHPDQSSEYHHHDIPGCILDAATGALTLVGYANDGFGIFVERSTSGALLTNADLDECHGRSSPVSWDGQSLTMYHYVATADYPYTVGCYRGTPSSR